MFTVTIALWGSSAGEPLGDPGVWPLVALGAFLLGLVIGVGQQQKPK